MGNISNKNEQNEQNYSLIRKINDVKYLIRHDQTQKLYLQVEHSFSNEQQLQQYIKRLNEWSFTHPYLLTHLKYFISSNSNVCSRHFSLLKLYPYQYHTLEQQIQSRINTNRSFEDTQLWSILCSCVLIMSQLCRKQLIHYTLSPKDIVITNNGEIKILPSDLSDFQFDYNLHENYYYAPEMFKAIKNNTSVSLSNKCGVFILGITILHVMFTKNMKDIYNYNSIDIDLNKLKEYIDAIQGQQFKNIITKMLKIQTYERITFTELEQMLSELLEGHNTSKTEDIKIASRIKDTSISTTRTNKFAESKDYGSMSINLYLEKDDQDSPNQSNKYIPITDNVVLDEQEIDLTKFTSSSNSKQINYDKQNSIVQMSDIINTIDNNKLETRQNCIRILQSNTKEAERNRTSKINYNSYQVESKKIEENKGISVYVEEQYSRGKYQGYKQNNMRHGFGTFYYREGGKYSGQWLYNKMEGRGALYYSNSKIAYEGEWKEDQLHGYGILYNERPIKLKVEFNYKNFKCLQNYWEKYEGNFKHDLKNGYGTLYLTNQECYYGNFLNDLPDGKGTYKNLFGKIIQAKWTHGKIYQPPSSKV